MKNLEETFIFKPQFYPWAQTPPFCSERFYGNSDTPNFLFLESSLSGSLIP